MLVACLTGCRQTTGVNTAGPLTPIAPLSPAASNGMLAPLGAGQAPTLGPFGGPTRVTPPSTGAYVAPNDYMGGSVGLQGNPLGAGGLVQSNPAGGGWNGLGNQTPIGSGVQQTGSWSAGSGLGQAANQSLSPLAPAPQSGVRSGGMQVIDLTGAPPPPGYQPSLRAIPTPNQQPGLAPAPAPSNSFDPAPSWRPPQVIVTPSQANIATAPSTEPIGASSGQSLQWRRPQ
jgi:hypothetical protein